MLDEASPLPSPWREFLFDIDALLEEPLALHCIGGFVICYCYGLPRVTGDIDYYSAHPNDPKLDEMAGEGSPLALKHKVWLHRVAVMSMPDEYDSRLTDMFPGQFTNLVLNAPDPYDFMLSKLERNASKDRDDVEFVFKKQKLSFPILRERYEKELRPYLSNEAKHDLTLEIWFENFGT